VFEIKYLPLDVKNYIDHIDFFENDEDWCGICFLKGEYVLSAPWSNGYSYLFEDRKDLVDVLRYWVKKRY